MKPQEKPEDAPDHARPVGDIASDIVKRIADQRARETRRFLKPIDGGEE